MVSCEEAPHRKLKSEIDLEECDATKLNSVDVAGNKKLKTRNQKF
jgi:hypothetical protein